MAEETKQHVQPYERAATPLSKRKIITNNFIGGLAWGLGVTLGLGLVLGLLGAFVARVDVIPVIGTFISNIYNFVIESNPNL